MTAGGHHREALRRWLASGVLPVPRDDAERPRPARFHVHAIADGERVRVPAVGRRLDLSAENGIVEGVAVPKLDARAVHLRDGPAR